MKTLWFFRTDIKKLEYYHEFKDLETFKLKCHDFYLLQGIWFLENDVFDEVIIWRLSDKQISDITFNINGKKFIQRWIKDPNEVFKYTPPTISFFRGGFSFYCYLTKRNPKFFGLKLYLAAGRRLLPQYGGIYDKILIEDEIDAINNSMAFYKTTNPNIFKPLDLKKKFDICIISNFSQLKYKGTDFIINQISKDKTGFLKSLKICHVGNNNKVGIKLCRNLNINNIEFIGELKRTKINKVLNKSKFGIVASNRQDGCPRVITEILTSGTPLFIKSETRLLDYYKNHGVIKFDNNNFVDKIKKGFQDYKELKKDLQKNLFKFEVSQICKLNFNMWLHVKNNS